MNSKKWAGWISLLAGFTSVLIFLACNQKTSAEENKRAVKVMFTNDVLGEYAPCG